MARATFHVETGPQRRQDGLAIKWQNPLGDKIGDLAVGVVDGGHRGLYETQIAEGAALVGVADQLQSAGARGAQRFQQWLEHTGTGLRRLHSQIHRFDRLKLALTADFTLRVKNRIDERRQIEQRCLSRVLSLASTTDLIPSATFAKTGTLAPACSSGAMSFLMRKSPGATTLPAIARRRVSS